MPGSSTPSVCAPARSSLHLPDGLPEHVRLPPRIPGTQRAPLGLRGPHRGVVGRGLRFYAAPGMACQETHAGVQVGVLGPTPRLYPGPPGVFDAGPYAGLLIQLSAGAGHEVLALLEHTAGVLPEPDGRLAAPEQQGPRLGSIEVDEHGPGPQVGGDHAGVLALRGWRGRFVRGFADLRHGTDGFGHAPDVLVVPPARQRHPFVERHPPVVEMLVGEADLVVARPSGVGYGGQASAARGVTDPGGDDAPRGDEHAGLLVQLAYGPLFQALSRLEASGRRLPGARG